MKIGPLLFAAAVVAFLVVRRRRLETESRVLLGLLATGLAVYGTGVVELPNVEEVLKDLGSRLGKWTYLLVAVMAFAETGAFLGFVAPGEFTVIFGGLVAGQGTINVIPLLAIVWACAVAGDVTSYLLGRRLGRPFLAKHGAKVKITEERLAAVERFFVKRGGLTILVGRFMGLVRPIAPFLAGSTRMPFRRFLPYDVIAAGLWSTTFVLLGYIFWKSFDRVVDLAHKGAFALGTTAVVVVGAIVAYRQLRDEQNRAVVGAWLDRQGERPLLRPFARVARAAWRVWLAPLGRLLAGPVRFAWHRLTPGQLGLELTTLLAVAAVGSFAFAGYAIVLQDIVTTTGDVRALSIADDLRTGLLVDVAKLVTRLGSLAVVAPVVSLAAAWLAYRRRVLESVALLAGMGLTVIGVHVAKAAMDRERPLGALVETEGSSWPSGHAAYAVALVAVAVALSRRSPARAVGLTVVAMVVAAAVGASRIYLHAHWLSDVLAGAGLSAALFAVCGMAALIVGFLRQNGKEA